MSVLHLITFLLVIVLLAELLRIALTYFYSWLKAQGQTSLSVSDVLEAAKQSGVGISKASAEDIIRLASGKPTTYPKEPPTSHLQLSQEMQTDSTSSEADLPLPQQQVDGELADIDVEKWNVCPVYYADQLLSELEDAPLPR